MDNREIHPLFLTPQVEQAEDRWREIDGDLDEIEQPIVAGADVPLDEILAIAREHLVFFEGKHEQARLEARRISLELGEHHPNTADARAAKWETFQYLEAAKVAWDRGVTAALEALRTGRPPGAAALAAIVDAHRRALPLATMVVVEQGRGEAAQAATVALTARLLVRRTLGDTGVKLFRWQQQALAGDAEPLGHSVPQALREHLPAAMLEALAEIRWSDDSKGILADLRTQAVARLVPRPRGRRPAPELASEEYVMAPPRSWTPAPPIEDVTGEAGAGDTVTVEIEAPSVESVVLDRLAEQELLAKIEAEASTLPKGKRRIIHALLRSYAASGEAPEYAEIADELGTSSNSVGVQLSHARRKLRQRGVATG